MSTPPKDRLSLQKELLKVINWFHSKGWAPATSTNYSFRNPGMATYTISRSGVDKGDFQLEDFMEIDAGGLPLEEYTHLKPSAETLIHTTLYQDPSIHAILHTHSVAATVLSLKYRKEGGITLQGFEVMKGIRDINTHDTGLTLPVLDNTQDMIALSAVIAANRAAIGYGFLLAGHGLYSWGKDIAEAKRQIEVFEFLFECKMYLNFSC
jgi:methylthioribulose-1-phosphate dehydratase